MRYFKELDSLRAFAALSVVCHHWISHSNLINKILHGPTGVTTFFVLSGFFTTFMVFKTKSKTEITRQTISKTYGNLLLKRSLRIFPAYFVSLSVLWLFKDFYIEKDISKAFIYLCTFSTNFYFFNHQYFTGVFAHLWSIATQEQFYLFWALLLLILHSKFHFSGIVFLIATGIACKYLLSDLPYFHLLPPVNFDSFGLGALLAWQITYKPSRITGFYTKVKIPGLLCLLLYLVGIVIPFNPIPERTVIAILALWLITYLIINSGSENLKFVFRNPALVFIGKISYGIYLFHNLIPQLTKKYVSIYILPGAPDVFVNHATLIVLTLNLIILFSISALTWFLIEQPIAQWKNFKFLRINPFGRLREI